MGTIPTVRYQQRTTPIESSTVGSSAENIEEEIRELVGY